MLVSLFKSTVLVLLQKFKELQRTKEDQRIREPQTEKRKRKRRHKKGHYNKFSSHYLPVLISYSILFIHPAVLICFKEISNAITVLGNLCRSLGLNMGVQ